MLLPLPTSSTVVAEFWHPKDPPLPPVVRSPPLLCVYIAELVLASTEVIVPSRHPPPFNLFCFCKPRRRRQVKRALGAQCFPVGGYAIQAYLPDEEVGISAFLCHGQEKSWFVRVNETLCKVVFAAFFFFFCHFSSCQCYSSETLCGGGRGKLCDMER